MSTLKAGDRVMVTAAANGDYSGPGTVAGVYGNGWVSVRSDGAWDEHTTVFDFEPERVTLLDESTPERHPNSARFHELVDAIAALHDKKQADYGKDDDPFANVRASSDWGIPAWVGAMVRLNDKVKRLQALAQKGELQNESALDSFDDIAVYALIARVLYEQIAA